MADRRRNLGIPSGVVFPFAGETAPYGYLICDGREVSRTEYASLFLSLGTSHGQGNGTTTFNLPDYRGNFLRGRVDISTVTGSGTSGVNNTATFTNHGINRTGFKVRLSSGTLSGLSASTDYFAIVIDANTLAFATSRINALANTRIAISGANSAVIAQWEDPDTGLRTASNIGGNSGDLVGSIQEYAFQGHWHDIGGGFDNSDGANPPSNTIQAHSAGVSTDATATLISRKNVREPTAGSHGNPFVSTETRPKNIAVNYIIKV